MFLDIVSFSKIGTQTLWNCWSYKETAEYPEVGFEEHPRAKSMNEMQKQIFIIGQSQLGQQKYRLAFLLARFDTCRQFLSISLEEVGA